MLSTGLPPVAIIFSLLFSITEEEFVKEWMTIAFGTEDKRKEFGVKFKVG